MVIAYHLVWTGYGWWLPNDPRGSGSRCVVNEELRKLGQLHLGRRATQPHRTVVRDFQEKAMQVLQHDLLRFDADQIECIGSSFDDAMRESGYTCYACAVMPDHVHLVIRKHRDTAETMIENLQAKSALELFKLGGIAANHPIWTNGGWRGFLDTPARVHTTICYVERNPENEGLPPQEWPFVTQYDNWPYHRRHPR
jgi:REP element-mobilizing transposase RayT